MLAVTGVEYQFESVIRSCNGSCTARRCIFALLMYELPSVFHRYDDCRRTNAVERLNTPISPGREINSSLICDICKRFASESFFLFQRFFQLVFLTVD